MKSSQWNCSSTNIASVLSVYEANEIVTHTSLLSWFSGKIPGAIRRTFIDLHAQDGKSAREKKHVEDR
jgi:hypothetical protein